MSRTTWLALTRHQARVHFEWFYPWQTVSHSDKCWPHANTGKHIVATVTQSNNRTLVCE